MGDEDVIDLEDTTRSEQSVVLHACLGLEDLILVVLHAALGYILPILGILNLLAPELLLVLGFHKDFLHLAPVCSLHDHHLSSPS
jgi:hypothetical protein